MTAFVYHFTYEFKKGIRNPSLLLMNYLFPIGFYLFMGAIFTQIYPGFNLVIIPAMITLTIMTNTILGMPGPLVEAREEGIFRSYKINGIPAGSILSIPAIATVIHALIASLLVALTAGPLFKGVAPSQWGNLAVVALVTAFTYSGLGTLIGVVAANSRGTVLWSQLIFLPSMLISGMVMPLSTLPASVRPFSFLLPTSYSMQAFSGLAYQQDTLINPWTALMILGVTGLVAYVLAGYLFNWDSRNNARRGHPLLGLLVLVPMLTGMLIK